MTDKQYWEENPYLLFVYEDKFKMERSLREQELWEIGVYVMRSLQATPVIATLYEKRSNLTDYPKMPEFYNPKPKVLSQEKKELLDKIKASAKLHGFQTI